MWILRLESVTEAILGLWFVVLKAYWGALHLLHPSQSGGVLTAVSEQRSSIKCILMHCFLELEDKGLSAAVSRLLVPAVSTQRVHSSITGHKHEIKFGLCLHHTAPLLSVLSCLGPQSCNTVIVRTRWFLKLPIHSDKCITVTSADGL